jgi:hypothetical protein
MSGIVGGIAVVALLLVAIFAFRGPSGPTPLDERPAATTPAPATPVAPK